MYNNRPGFWSVLSSLHSRHLEHDSTSFAAICIVIIIIEIHHFPNTRLNDHFGTIVARKQGHINGSTSYIS
jgi:hypothetical protein